MQETEDIELLRQYVEQNSEDAFAVLVARHVNTVYSVALRKTGTAHAAEEIAQAVFIIFSKKARGLRKESVLSGWLYQTARLASANFLRGEIRRAHREQEAFMQSLSNEPAPELWPQIVPLLDDAIGKLGYNERNALALRFFEGKSFSEIARVVGASENAAKKRVGCALEKLRHYFSKRGVVSTASAIEETISIHSVIAAPVGLAATISATAAKGSAVAVSTMTLVKGTLKIMTYAKLKLAMGIAAAALLAAGTVDVAFSALTGDQDSPGEASAQEKTFANEIMQATADEDYQAFVADGDKAFKTIKEPQFKAVCVQITPRLKKGYHVVFLGGLNKESYHVTIWKITYDDSGDDDLLDLSVKNGKIGGAYIH